jgi:hypothetical protein
MDNNVTKATSPSASPLPPKVNEANKLISFAEAIDEVRRGKKITKLEWKDKNYYGFMNEARLRLHEPNGTLHEWMISEGDIIGNDWMVV